MLNENILVAQSQFSVHIYKSNYVFTQKSKHTCCKKASHKEAYWFAHSRLIILGITYQVLSYKLLYKPRTYKGQREQLRGCLMKCEKI